MGAAIDFLRYGLDKSARKLWSALRGAWHRRRDDRRPVRSYYGVMMTPNWGDKTFRYCIDGIYGDALADHLRGMSAAHLFLDIGANQGLYSLIAATNPNIVHVHAFEPVAASHALLCANIALNHTGDRITAHAVAISADCGPHHIRTRSAHSGAATIADDDRDGPGETIRTIDAAALDQLIGGDWPILVKVDVEGHEAVVIAELMKSRHRDRITAIFYEVDRRWSAADRIAAMLRDAGLTRHTRFGRGHHYDVLAERGGAESL